MLSPSFVLCLTFLVVVTTEIISPRNPDSADDIKRWLSNAALFILDQLGGRAILVVLVATGIVGDISASPLGDQQLSIIIITIAGTFLLFDFSSFVAHVFLHRVPFLWRIHQVHHSDSKLDFSTQLRFHPAEMLITLGIQLSLILIFDIPGYAIMTATSIGLISGLIVHSNSTLMFSVDRTLQCLFVTPDMHHIHHSCDKNHFDKNFGIALSIWDRIFGSYIELSRDELNRLSYGDSDLSELGNLSLLTLLALPFKRLKQVVTRDA